MSGVLAFFALTSIWFAARIIKRSRAKARLARLRLEGEEQVSQRINDYGSISSHTSRAHECWRTGGEPCYAADLAAFYPEHPRTFL